MSSKTQNIAKSDLQLRRPPMYAVYMHNDDYTTMEFVVDVLIRIFNKKNQEATKIMMAIHENGYSVVDIYTYDIAVTKKMQTDQLAAEKEFPLRVTINEVHEV